MTPTRLNFTLIAAFLIALAALGNPACAQDGDWTLKRPGVTPIPDDSTAPATRSVSDATAASRPPEGSAEASRGRLEAYPTPKRTVWGFLKDIGSGVGLLAGIGEKNDVKAMREAFFGGIKEDFASGAMRDRIFAYGKGLGKGLYGAAKGTVSAVLHPIDTINGVAYAIENWDETKARFGKLIDEYIDAAYNDPDKFAEMTGVLAGEAIFAVAGTKGLDKLSKARFVARTGAAVRTGALSGLTRAGNFLGPRVASAGRRVAALAGRASSLPRAFLRSAGTRLATNPVLHRTLATLRGTGRWIGNAAARTAATATAAYNRTLRPVVNWVGPRAAGGVRALPGLGARLAKSMGRGTWTMVRTSGVPVVVAFDDEIAYYAERWDTVRDARKDVRRSGDEFLGRVAELEPHQIGPALAQIAEAFEGYRTHLFKPVHTLDIQVKKDLDDLDAAIRKGSASDDALETRMNGIFEAYATRKHRLVRDIFTRDKDEPHSWESPSANRLLSYDDEMALLMDARGRARSPEVARAITERLHAVERQRDEELRLLSEGRLDALVPGSAGGMVSPDEDTAPTPDSTGLIDALRDAGGRGD